MTFCERLIYSMNSWKTEEDMERYKQQWSQTLEAIKGRSRKQNWVEKETQNKHRSRATHFRWNWHVKRMVMNVLSMTMVSFYLHTSPRQTNPFLISLSLRNKLLILFPSVMQTNVKGMIISRWRYSRYVPRKLLSLCKLFFKNVYLLEHFPTFRSMLIFSIFRCCRFVGKS